MAKFGQIFTNLNRYKNQSANVIDNITQGIDLQDIVSRGITNGLPGILSVFTQGGDIDNLKSSIGKRDGLSSPNRFLVSLNVPTSLRGKMNVDERDHYLLCESCTLPGLQIYTSEYSQNNKKVEKMPYGYTTDDVEMTFILTNDMYFRKLFEEWTNLIVDRDTYTLSYKNEYKSDVTISLLDKTNRPRYSVKLEEAFPINISALDLNNSTNDDYLRVSVTMTYSKHKKLD